MKLGRSVFGALVVAAVSAALVPSTVQAMPRRGTAARDAAPPVVRVRGPRSATPGQATYRFFVAGGDATGLHYVCRLDSVLEAPCTDPFTTPPLAIGIHTLRVRAVDASGTAGPVTAIEIDVQVALPGVQTPAVTTIELDAYPGPDTFAFTSDAVWVGDRLFAGANVLRIDPSSNTLAATIPLPQVCSLAAGFGAVYVGQCIHNAHGLSRIDAGTSTVTATTSLPRAGSVETLDGSVWATEFNLGEVMRFDPTTLDLIATVPVAAHPYAATAAFGSIWSVGLTSCRVNRVDPSTDAVVETVRVHTGPAICEAAGATADAVWVTDDLTNRLYRIDPVTGGVTAIDIGAVPKGIWGEGSIAADATDLFVRTAPTQVSRIDPTSGAVLNRYELGRNIMGLGLGFGSLWIGSPNLIPGPQAVLRMPLS
jgi:streptogramin lyase